MKTKEKQQKLLSIKDYAEQCGVKPAAIRYRIDKGLIAVTTIETLGHTITCIDANIYPPVRLREEKK